MAAECGLDDVAAVPAHPVPCDAADLSARLAGYPPELGYLSRGMQRRLDPSRVLPGVRTVITACLSYATPHPGARQRPPGSAFVSRFAWCPDYHLPVGEAVARLAAAVSARTGSTVRWYVDTGPVLEKAYAAAAGLGFIGRHGLLVHPRLGSFVFLGVVLTDAEVTGGDRRPDLPGCGTCTACVQACPTGALGDPYRLDVHRCLAHLTVTSREPFPPGVPLDSHLYGCDRCQDACPYNRRADVPDRAAFRPLPGLPFMAPAEVLAMDETAFQQRFGTTPARRRGLAGLQATARALIDRESRGER